MEYSFSVKLQADACNILQVLADAYQQVLQMCGIDLIQIEHRCFFANTLHLYSTDSHNVFCCRKFKYFS